MSRAAWRSFLLLFRAQWREQPGRMLIVVIAIALGVALGAGVYFTNRAALAEFAHATRQLTGSADVLVRGPPDGFNEGVFVDLAQDPQVAVASPVLELDAAVRGRREPLKVLALDPFRAATLQPTLLADLGDGVLTLLRGDGVFVSTAAARELDLAAGGRLELVVGGQAVPLRVLGVLAPALYAQPLVVMDIAAAQWKFNLGGRVNRIDLQLRPGIDVAQFSSRLAAHLPTGVLAGTPGLELERADAATRAYRVNLNVLALVALWTGAFLVFSTQALAVLRRQRAIALLRALGLTRGEVRRVLLAEGLALGGLGAVVGLLLGAVLATVLLRLLTGDLGNPQLRSPGATLTAAPLASLAFVGIGVLTGAIGAWLPALGAARLAPAAGLKGSTAAPGRLIRGSVSAGLTLLLAGTLLAFAPALRGLPLFGYAAIALLLFGAVLLVPALTRLATQIAPPLHGILFRLARAQLAHNLGLTALSLASMIVSFSLMVAMATMVYSFRQSFEVWLDRLLPADLQLREAYGNDTAFLTAAVQRQMATLPGVARAEFRLTQRLLLDAARPAVTLIVRGADPAATVAELPLMGAATPVTVDAAAPPVWISEAVGDVYGLRTGQVVTLPLNGARRFTVAGVWRDYARSAGSVVMSQATYRAAGGDERATEASLWLRPGITPADLERRLRDSVPATADLEIISSQALHDRSLRIFDRAFAITYALEGVAVLIGLLGVSFAASSAALSRRAEFGMLRHVGMLRRQVLGLIATEGLLTSALGVIYGLVLGLALSLVLVFVINRQSFNWSIDLALPLVPLGALSALLVIAATLTAVISGRAALSMDAVRAVREDW